MLASKKKNLKEKDTTYINKQFAHDSAEKHVSGEAVYVDDILDYPEALHCCFFCSNQAHAQIQEVDISEAQKMAGVVDIIQAKDVPAKLDIAPVFDGDPLLADKKVEFFGQPIVAVAAKDMYSARKAVQKIKVKYKSLEPILDLKEALQKKSFVLEPQLLQRGNVNLALQKAKHRLNGEFFIGGQDHFYLETQISLAVPQEDGVFLYCSTQNPTEVQKLVAEVIGLKMSQVVVDTRRMGGGFGGKETQSAQAACIAALFAYRNRLPVKMRLNRFDDMLTTGKRHNFYNTYEVGFNNAGVIEAIKIKLAAQCGYSADLSLAILARAMLHSDNCYYFKNVKIEGYPCKTHTVSNTAFRGFGGPQGMLHIEHIIDEVARYLKKDPLDIMQLNFYENKNGRNITPYEQEIEEPVIAKLVEELVQTSEYKKRRKEVALFNQSNPNFSKGIAISPVKFGISFTVTFMNQAGALIHIYSDGSVHLNHGGTEMGQGLFIKVAQVVAEEFQIDLNKISITSTRTDKVPNTSPTAASAGSDLNGKAAQVAARKIKARLIQFAATYFKTPAEDIFLKQGKVYIAKNKKITFEKLIALAYENRIALSSTGYYKTPKIHFDKKNYKGRPFLYFSYGAAVSEVLVDTLTGEYKVLRTDILHDIGNSINPAVDRGQVEGGFVQGMGWLTCEELGWDKNGRALALGPDTYKIPAVTDLPQDFRVHLKTHSNNEDTVFRSKAVGEPPLMLANSVWLAIKDAVSYFAKNKRITLNAPATPVEVFNAIQIVQQN